MEEVPVVSFDNVDKIFNRGGADETVALQSINLDIWPSEFISIIGPSGCGKSTLLRLVGDLIAPTTGSITVNGKEAHRARLDHDYGMVFQRPVLFDWRTIQRNVELPLEVYGYDKKERQERARELLKMVELTGFENHRPWQLSGGMQQRASIARALATSPKLLLMDEPFGALDEMTRERMNKELHDIWRLTDTTVIFVTHSISEAAFLSNRVIVMSARPGQIMHIVDIDLPVPRGEHTRQDPALFEAERTLREWLRKAEAYSA
jgi:NitT/TauT family transport system ATP-binding protein